MWQNSPLPEGASRAVTVPPEGGALEADAGQEQGGDKEGLQGGSGSSGGHGGADHSGDQAEMKENWAPGWALWLDCYVIRLWREWATCWAVESVLEQTLESILERESSLDCTREWKSTLDWVRGQEPYLGSKTSHPPVIPGAQVQQPFWMQSHVRWPFWMKAQVRKSLKHAAYQMLSQF